RANGDRLMLLRDRHLASKHCVQSPIALSRLSDCVSPNQGRAHRALTRSSGESWSSALSSSGSASLLSATAHPSLPARKSATSISTGSLRNFLCTRAIEPKVVAKHPAVQMRAQLPLILVRKSACRSPAQDHPAALHSR